MKFIKNWKYITFTRDGVDPSITTKGIKKTYIMPKTIYRIHWTKPPNIKEYQMKRSCHTCCRSCKRQLGTLGS